MSDATKIRLRILTSDPRMSSTNKPYRKVEALDPSGKKRPLMVWSMSAFDVVDAAARLQGLVDAELGDKDSDSNYIVKATLVDIPVGPAAGAPQTPPEPTPGDPPTHETVQPWVQRPMSAEDRVYALRMKALEVAGGLHQAAIGAGVADLEPSAVIATAVILEPYLVDGAEAVDAILTQAAELRQAELDAADPDPDAPAPVPPVEEMTEADIKVALERQTIALGWTVDDLRAWLRKDGNGFGPWQHLKIEQRRDVVRVLEERVIKHQSEATA